MAGWRARGGRAGTSSASCHDGAGRVTGVEDSTGEAVSFAYDENGNGTETRYRAPAGEDEAAEAVVRLRYDAMDRLVSRQQEDAAPERFEYDAFGGVVAHIRPSGMAVGLLQDALGRRGGRCSRQRTRRRARSRGVWSSMTTTASSRTPTGPATEPRIATTRSTARPASSTERHRGQGGVRRQRQRRAHPGPGGDRDGHPVRLERPHRPTPDAARGRRRRRRRVVRIRRGRPARARGGGGGEVRRTYDSLSRVLTRTSRDGRSARPTMRPAGPSPSSIRVAKPSGARSTCEAASPRSPPQAASPLRASAIAPASRSGA